MNVLITSAGRRVSLIKAFQKEIKKAFVDGKVFSVDANPEESAACHISDGCYKVPRIGDPDYIAVLLAHCIEKKVRLIIPTIDTELLTLAQNKSLFEDNGIKIIITSSEFIKKCRNKGKFINSLKTLVFPRQKNIKRMPIPCRYS